MITIDIHRFSTCNYARVSMQQGDTWPIPQGTNEASFGVVVLNGSTTVVACEDLSLIGHKYPTSPSVQPVPDVAYTVQADTDVSWVCVSNNDTGPRQIAYQQFEASYSVPADWGFIVISGEVDVGGVPVPVDGLYRPRDSEVVIAAAGAAEILLVR